MPGLGRALGSRRSKLRLCPLRRRSSVRHLAIQLGWGRARRRERHYRYLSHPVASMCVGAIFRGPLIPRSERSQKEYHVDNPRKFSHSYRTSWYHQSFIYSPTGALVSCIKNNIKIYFIIYIKRAPTYFSVTVTPSIRERINLSLLKLQLLK